MDKDSPQTDSHNQKPLNLDMLRELLLLLRQSDVSEISIERDDIKLHIKRDLSRREAHAPHQGHHDPQMRKPPATPSDFSHSPDIDSFPFLPSHLSPSSTYQPSGSSGSMNPSQANGHTLRSPMVGLFRAAPSPGSRPLVQEGDTIFPGDTVCFIESMDTLTDIECDIAGRVMRLLVKDGQPVEYGQPLMIIEPS